MTGQHSNLLNRLYQEAKESGDVEWFLEALKTGQLQLADQTPEEQEVVKAFIEKLNSEN